MFVKAAGLPFNRYALSIIKMGTDIFAKHIVDPAYYSTQQRRIVLRKWFLWVI